MGQSRKKRRASVGVLFWVAIILLVAVIFLANRTNIERVLQSTGLVQVIQDEFGLGAESAPTVDQQDNDPPAGGDGESGADQDGSSSGDEAPGASDSEPLDNDIDNENDTIVVSPEQDGLEGGDESQDNGDPATSSGSGAASDSSASSDTPTDDDSSTGEGEESVATVPDNRDGGPVRERSAAIYFIRVTDDGAIHPERVQRTVEYVDTPMTATLETLLAGPTAQELSLGLLNLIPDGTELLSARVDSSVAYLNFNEAFRFNSMGAEGLIAQLQQIVFSSTEFSTVEKVQILIEGQRIEYLGEGIYTGGPIGREQFS